MRTPLSVVAACRIFAAPAFAAEPAVDFTPPAPADVSLSSADVFVDPAAADVVRAAADLFADDVNRVTGHRPTIRPDAATLGPVAVLVGTLGDGGPADALAAAGTVDAAALRGKWESYLWQTVDHPLPRVDCALVVLGSDRRGTAYGLTQLSRAIGVSPWYWWADVPTPHHDAIRVTPGRHVESSPKVQYRGIFINDEDWGFRPWATQTLDPTRPEVGPVAYGKLFELMLRLRLNYLWPAMHPGSGEFGSVPGNAAAADRWAVVMGASHCEPMLRNNVYWPKNSGPWRYDTNTEQIHDYWADAVHDRGDYEAVWTLGIRGIHDAPMDGPKGTPARVAMVDRVFADQRKLLAGVTKRFGPVAQCFVPYKEVLPLYDAGLAVPPDVTLVWPDDNFGYIRHLPTAAERARPGGSGVYYHLSYLGAPQSYLWTETTSPGLIWEELRKAYANDAGRLWVVNVGDVKPAEVAIDFYADLAWNPDGWGPDAQDVFLRAFFARTFGAEAVGPLASLQADYYRLAAVRRPEQFTYDWMNGQSPAALTGLARRYSALLSEEKLAAAAIPPAAADAYFEMIGYPAQMLALTGLLHLSDEAALAGDPPADAEAKRCYAAIVDVTRRYNDTTAGGKWRGMMSMTPSGVSWPTRVGGTHRPRPLPATRPTDNGVTIDAATLTTVRPDVSPAWHAVAGLGHSGSALAILPATPWAGPAPSVEMTFTLAAPADAAAIRIHLLPTMRLDPAGRLRFAVTLDGGPPQTYDVPGGDLSDENAGPRRDGVLTNRVTVPLRPAPLAAGPHTLRLTAVDPGVDVDQLTLPAGTTPGRK